MASSLKSLLRPLLLIFMLMSVLTGVIYPLSLTLAGHWLFADQASGSLVKQQGQLVGSSLIGQAFQDPRYFWGRLSATAPTPYNAAASGGSNFGPTNPALLDAVKARIAQLRAADADNTLPIPVDLVTASASGLDPDISPAAAFYQINRVARARGIDPQALRRRVQQQVRGPQWGIFGEARVNVLMLNLSLDRAQ
jgi:potassium-transporting ATPase KdpC subunit